MANNKKSPGSLLKSKKFRYGSLSVVFTAVTLAFIIGINLVITAFNASHIFSIDFTDQELYSISDATVEYLEGLGDDFEITVHFCTARDRLEEYEETGFNYFRMVHELVLAFQEKFPDNIEVAYFDVTTDPKYVNDIKHYTQTTLNASNIIVEGKHHTRVLNFDAFFMVAESDNSLYAFNGESRLVSAITQCSIKEPYSVLFTQGHGETVSDSLKGIFADAGFETIFIDLNKATDDELEEAFKNARIMVISDPQKDLVGYNKNDPNADDETDIINKFLEGNRSLMVFVDASTPDLPNLREYLNTVWGLDYVPNDILSDNTHSLKLDKNTILAQSSGETGSAAAQFHIAFADDTDIKTVFGDTVKLATGKASNGAVTDVAFKTFSTSADKAGQNGEYPVLAVSTFMDYQNNAAKYQYVALCGSTEFVSDISLTAQYGNREVIEAAARMMSTDRVSPDIDYKVFADTALTLETGEAKTLSVIVIVVAPLIVLVLGVGVYIKRRHL